MSETCPYCGQEYTADFELYRHAIAYHGGAVLSYWVDEYDVQPPISGQQRLQEAVA
jgi:hypothetical protein